MLTLEIEVGDRVMSSIVVVLDKSLVPALEEDFMVGSFSTLHHIPPKEETTNLSDVDNYCT
jgi:hypothetical protein